MLDVSTLEPAVQDWLKRNRELHRDVPSPRNPLWFPGRRRAERERSDRLAAEFARPIDHRVAIADVTIAGVRARRFMPSASRPGPTQVFLHGGGFVSGSAFEGLNTAILSERAAEAELQIIALEYGLAPRHPYPTAVRQTLAVVGELARDHQKWGLDPSRIGLGGNSAGGHIASVAALCLRDAARTSTSVPRLRHLLLEVPAVDLTHVWPSEREVPTAELRAAMLVAAVYAGPLLPAGALLSRRPAARGRTAPGSGRIRPPLARLGRFAEYLSPVDVVDLAGLPRTLVMTAGLDPLRDPAEEFGRRLQSAGVDADTRRGNGVLHGTTGLGDAVPSARAWRRAAIEELSRLTGHAA